MLHVEGDDEARTDNRCGRSANQQAKRVRTNFTDSQLRRLEETFTTRPFPSRDLISSLSGELGLSYFSIKTWFQNKRSKSRRNGSFDVHWSAGATASEVDTLSDNRLSRESTLTSSESSQVQPQSTPCSPVEKAKTFWPSIQSEVLKDLEKFALNVMNKPINNFHGQVSTFDEANINTNSHGNGNRDVQLIEAHAKVSDDEQSPSPNREQSYRDTDTFLDQSPVCFSEHQMPSGIQDGDGKSHTQKPCRVHSDKESEDQYSALYCQYGGGHYPLMYNYLCYEYYEKARACYVHVDDGVEQETKSALVCDLDSHQVKEVKREQFPEVHPSNHHVLSWNYMY